MRGSVGDVTDAIAAIDFPFFLDRTLSLSSTISWGPHVSHPRQLSDAASVIFVTDAAPHPKQVCRMRLADLFFLFLVDGK